MSKKEILSKAMLVGFSTVIMFVILFTIYTQLGGIRDVYFKAGDWQMWVVLLVFSWTATSLFNWLFKWELHSMLGPKPRQRFLRRRRM